MNSRGIGPLSLCLLTLCSIALLAAPLGAEPPRASVTTVTTTPDGGASASVIVGGPGAAYHPSRVLVRFRSGVRDFLHGSGPTRGFPNGDPDLFLVQNPPGLSVAEVVQRYERNPNVVYAEPDFDVHTLELPTDPRWSEQWDMMKISAPLAWDVSSQRNASDTVVAVIDTGIDFTHPDFIRPDLTSNVDHANSYVCIGGSCVSAAPDPTPGDDFGHGTHVAGTIGAATNNGAGIAGINWTARMISMKFLNSGGSGSISDAILVFNKLVQLKNGGLNVRVTNNSWGGGGYSQALKDAMAAAEQVGIVHVCAAGNNAQNADPNPMYPAAYDNRGIVSVLATNDQDVGAGFTNYGLASVDIAAPGVLTLSTVPTGTCTLCDGSGYRLLSGTSMATPHVAGVMAALFHKKPALTPIEARDIVLDPGSYDVMTDAKAKFTSTGGRLNFKKVMDNANVLSTRPLNTFPTIAMGSNVFTSAGSTVNVSAQPNDPDAGDVPGLRTQFSKLVSTGSSWLFGWMLGSVFPDPPAGANSFSFIAPSLGRTASVPYDGATTDNRGGGAHGQQIVTVSPMASPSNPPTGTLSLSSSTLPVGGTVTVNFPVSDPQGPPAWDLWAAGLGGSSGWCCFTGSAVNVTFNSAGTYRIGVQAIDRELNLSTRQTAMLQVGGATGTSPQAAATLDKVSGPVPLTVNVDMSGSTAAPGKSIMNYFIGCGGGFTAASGPTGSCAFDSPGTYWLLLQVQDNTGQMDLLSAYVVATPQAGGGGGGDTTPPTVSITAPAPGADVSAPITVSANASDAGGSGVTKVEFRLDDPVSGSLIGSDSGSPYSIPWNPSGTSTGPHTLYAIATDVAGNVGTSAGVGITVSPPPPPPTITISVPKLNPARNSNLTISATTSPAVVTKVEFYINDGTGNKLVGTDTTAPYTFAWKVPNVQGKVYTLSAKAYSSSSGVGSSNTITVTPK